MIYLDGPEEEKQLKIGKDTIYVERDPIEIGRHVEVIMHLGFKPGHRPIKVYELPDGSYEIPIDTHFVDGVGTAKEIAFAKSMTGDTIDVLVVPYEVHGRKRKMHGHIPLEGISLCRGRK